MKEIFYRQCHLKKGKWEQTTWLPEKFAVEGKVLKIKGDNGWVVEKVFQTRLEERLLPDYHNDSKAHKKATGDA